MADEAADDTTDHSAVDVSSAGRDGADGGALAGPKPCSQAADVSSCLGAAPLVACNTSTLMLADVENASGIRVRGELAAVATWWLACLASF